MRFFFIKTALKVASNVSSGRCICDFHHILLLFGVKTKVTFYSTKPLCCLLTYRDDTRNMVLHRHRVNSVCSLSELFVVVKSLQLIGKSVC